MNVCLVRPFSDTFVVSPPFGLGYLASALRQSHHTVSIVDALRIGGTLKTQAPKTLAHIMQAEPDVIGIQAFSCDYSLLASLLAQIRKTFPKQVIVMGGPHPSGVGKLVFDQFPMIDYAVAGEGETPLTKLLEYLKTGTPDLGSIPGLIYKKNNINQENSAIFEQDIDQWGYPAWDLIDPSSYPHAPHQGVVKRFPVAPIITTRGCPYQCTFCSGFSVTGRRLRYRTVKNVVDEIEILLKTYGVKEIHIEDDNFTMKKAYVKEFAAEVKKRGLVFPWHCSSGVRLDSLDGELIQTMVDCGCYNFTVAIESGVDQILKDMRKSTTIEKVKAKISILNEMGHEPVGLFMLGFPTETPAQARTTIKFACSLGLRRAQFAIFHPLPGSPVYNEMMEKGLLKGLVWDNLKPERLAFKHQYFSERHLKFLQKYAFLKFHLRPKILFKTLGEMFDSGNFYYIFKRVVSYLFR